MTVGVASAVATLAVAGAGLWATWALTDGGRAFTTESARRLSIEQTPRAVPVTSWSGEGAGAERNVLAGLGPVRIVDFVYTGCPSVCQTLGSTYGQLTRELAEEIARGEVALLSVGFDLEHDTVQALDDYRARHAAGAGWRALAPRGPDDLRALVDTFGVTVLADGAGGYVHNAALSVVDARGRLVAVFDVQDVKAVAERARRLSSRGAP
jgi:protein SCO1